MGTSMLEQHLQQLTSDLELDPIEPKDQTSLYHLNLTPEMKISMKELEPGLYLFSQIGPCPTQKKEDSFIYLMKANFLGQGTGGKVIGMDPEEKFLTLSHVIPYDMNYKSFKELIEDFANYLDYWRGELKRLQKAAEESIM
jgi:hypothetical protein